MEPAEALAEASRVRTWVRALLVGQPAQPVIDVLLMTDELVTSGRYRPGKRRLGRLLLEQLTLDWGVDQHDEGTVTWAVLTLLPLSRHRRSARRPQLPASIPRRSGPDRHSVSGGAEQQEARGER